MILNFDVKGLEVVAACYLSKDATLKSELDAEIDIHTMNMNDLGLPNRGVAKTFQFRILYGGSVFHNDPDFTSVSTSRRFWDRVIEKYYEKYHGIYKWHVDLIRTVNNTGMITNPTGRTFRFERIRNYKGELEYPATQIKNHPVQSLGADIMSLIRVDFYRKFKNAGISGIIVNSVHDSIVLDLDGINDVSAVDRTRDILYNVLTDFPHNFERIFGVPFDLKIHGEIEIGKNMYDMVKI